LRAALGHAPAITLWSSTAGRALQTLAIMTDHLALDWHQARRDDRLVEIGTGSWGGRSYADIMAEQGNIVFAGTGLLHPSPDGEPYADVASRLIAWAEDTHDDPGDRLVVMHGISSRVLRGILAGHDDHPAIGVPAADSVPQGSVVMLSGGQETLLLRGTGFAPA
jgi:probable phosphoglycerate mutase